MIDANTNPIEVAEIQPAQGIFAMYGSANPQDYLGDQATIDVGPSQEAGSVSQAENAEEYTYAAEIGSTSGEMYVKVPDGPFNLEFNSSEEQKAAYIEAVRAFLDASESYIKNTEVISNIDKYSIPNSPNSLMESVFLFSEILKANAEPIAPFIRPPVNLEHPIQDRRYSERAIINGEEKDFNCLDVSLNLGIGICVQNHGEQEGLNISDDQLRTVATGIYQISSIIAQGYPIALSSLAAILRDVADTYKSPEAIKAYIAGMENAKKPSIPTPGIPGYNTPSTTRAKYEINPFILRDRIENMREL